MSVAFDVVVLAGGRSIRYGSDKLVVTLDRVLDGLPPDAAIVCVGDELSTTRQDITWLREEPAFGGPLLALARGFSVGQAEVVVVVGGDMPRVGASVSALLVAVRSNGRPAVLVDAAGVPQPLASAWPRRLLEDLLAGLGPLTGRPIRLLLSARGGFETVPDAWDASIDVDLPTDE